MMFEEKYRSGMDRIKAGEDYREKLKDSMKNYRHPVRRFKLNPAIACSCILLIVGLIYVLGRNTDFNIGSTSREAMAMEGGGAGSAAAIAVAGGEEGESDTISSQAMAQDSAEIASDILEQGVASQEEDSIAQEEIRFLIYNGYRYETILNNQLWDTAEKRKEAKGKYVGEVAESQSSTSNDDSQRFFPQGSKIYELKGSVEKGEAYLIEDPDGNSWVVEKVKIENETQE